MWMNQDTKNIWMSIHIQDDGTIGKEDVRFLMEKWKIKIDQIIIIICIMTLEVNILSIHLLITKKLKSII